MQRIRSRLSYANVMSTIAVFLTLGGASALAASQLAKNSVGTKQLKKNAVTAAKIKANAVSGAKVADGSLTGADVADKSLTGADVADKSLTNVDLADNAVTSAKVLDKTLTGKDVADNSLTGTDINESTLSQVPDAARLGGRAASGFVTTNVYRNESATEAGTSLGDGTFYIDEACNPGDILLSGGPANVNSTSVMVESFPTPGLTNSWRARIKPTAADNFSVVALCARTG